MSGGKSRQEGLETPRGEVLVYQEDGGRVKLEVRLEEETVWLTQQLIAELFQTSVPNISMHIRNIFEEGELTPEATLKKFLTVRQEGARQVQRNLDFYNLDMIISVGYRVKSLIATRFRIWATRQLREFLVKGFVMDDERLKNPPVKGSAVPDSINELLALDSTSPSRFSIRHSRVGGNPPSCYRQEISQPSHPRPRYRHSRTGCGGNPNWRSATFSAAMRHSSEGGNPPKENPDETTHCLYPRQQAQRHPVHRRDQRLSQANLGAQKPIGRRIYQKIPRSTVGLFRATPRHAVCHYQRETAQEMESRLENRADRGGKSGLARFMGGYPPISALDGYLMPSSFQQWPLPESWRKLSSLSFRHSRVNGNPDTHWPSWIPAYAGMTGDGQL